VTAAAARKRVLVADADSAIRQSIVSFVSARGYTVDHTDNGSDAASLLSSERIDVLVADVGVADAGSSSWRSPSGSRRRLGHW
jgi:DNA-binding response OmpR family regulator